MDGWENPLGTDGFEFVEFAAPDPQQLGDLFERMGFRCVAKHRSKDVILYRQGEVNFIVNREPGSFGQAFARVHGPSICAMGFRVRDAAHAYSQAVELGAWGVESKVGPMELNIPAIKGVGDSLIYLVDRYGARGTIYDVDFVPVAGQSWTVDGVGFSYIDHLTHNVHRGRMAEWSSFYERLFNFREIRYFDIEGQWTGLRSQAMTSPCGKIRIPINESSDEHSQIQEYLEAYRGEGIQHVALGTSDIFSTVESLRASHVSLLDTPDAYYKTLDTRVPGHGEDVKRLRENRILLDGAPMDGKGILLQIFTDPVVGPIFFEIIQRKGNQGFGEGNFQALFESMERDQVKRGVLKP